MAVRVRGMLFRDEDDAHDYFAQRRLDDEAEARAEDAARMDAFYQGMHDGRQGRGPNMNPHDHESPLHAIWERGRMAGLGETLNYFKRKIA